jgi:hypothetical protein
VQGSLGPCLAYRDIEELASVDYFHCVVVEEAVERVTAECVVIAEIHGLRSLGRRAVEIVDFEMEATSGFVGHSRSFLLVRGYQIQETFRPVHSSDLKSHFSWVFAQLDFVDVEAESKIEAPSCVAAFVETSSIAVWYLGRYVGIA